MQSLNDTVCFSSFVSSFLLTSKEVSYMSLTKSMNAFCEKYPFCCIIEPDNDFNVLSSFVELQENGMAMKKDMDYDSIIHVGNKKMTILNYLKKSSLPEILSIIDNSEKYVRTKKKYNLSF